MIINAIIFDNIVMYCHQFFVILCCLGDLSVLFLRVFSFKEPFLMDSTGMLFISFSIVQDLVGAIDHSVCMGCACACQSLYTVYSIIIMQSS